MDANKSTEEEEPWSALFKSWSWQGLENWLSWSTLEQPICSRKSYLSLSKLWKTNLRLPFRGEPYLTFQYRTIKLVWLITQLPHQQLSYVEDASQDWCLTILHAAIQRQSRKTINSFSAGHIILTTTFPVGNRFWEREDQTHDHRTFVNAFPFIWSKIYTQPLTSPDWKIFQSSSLSYNYDSYNWQEDFNAFSMIKIVTAQTNIKQDVPKTKTTKSLRPKIDLQVHWPDPWISRD